MLVVKDLKRLTLGPVNLTLAPGEVVALCGSSGSGKTLMMRALADLDPCDGQVSLKGVDRSLFSGPDWRKAVAWIPAEAGWWTDLVSDHYTDWQTCLPLVEELGLSPDCGNWSVSRASTGERQRLALIRALVLKPQVLLLDEPTSGLDSQSVKRVEALIARQSAAGAAVLWTTHDVTQAARVSTRTLWIKDGHLSEAAP